MKGKNEIRPSLPREYAMRPPFPFKGPADVHKRPINP
jgi:hypothetical protein